MPKITQRCFEATGRPAFICDFSPPRSGDPSILQQATIDADFISVAYSPGRAVRTSSALLAAAIKHRQGKDVVFTLATRDMNPLALHSLLLGAQLLDLENVIVLQGDPFSQRDLALVQPAPAYPPTQFIADIARMNQGVDFRGSSLRAPTDFCVGATVDLGRGVQREAKLARRKVEAGAEFFITQPIFDPVEAHQLQEAYARVAGSPLATPIFYGLQVLEPDGVIFSTVPREVREELEGGRSGVEIAVELWQRFQQSGLHNIYLVPPIRRGGARNYAAAREVLAAARTSGP